MKSEYLIIDKAILPDYFDLVLQAKTLVEDENLSVSVACKQTGISRSTFYKYKDRLFRASASYGRKTILTVKLADIPGVLSRMIQEIYSYGGNIISINSALPIKGVSFVTIVLDVQNLATDAADLVVELKKIENVKSANIVAVE